jgi:hypothetical protein
VKLRADLGVDNGADFIRDALISIHARTSPTWQVPSRSTINRVLSRHDLLVRRDARACEREQQREAGDHERGGITQVVGVGLERQAPQAHRDTVDRTARSVADLGDHPLLLATVHLHDPLEQALVIVADDPERAELAARFIAHVNTGREGMRRYGFLLPGEAPPEER